MARKQKNQTSLVPLTEEPGQGAKRGAANDERKMTIYEYEERYVRHQNLRGARLVLGLLAGIIGVFIGWCLFSFTMELWKIHPYLGYGAAAISIILFFLVYVVPLVKILRSDYFMTNVNSEYAGKAKRHNRRVRRNIAEKMVDFHRTVGGIGWYDSKSMDDLKRALQYNDDALIKTTLSAMYKGKVKKTAKEIIFKCALKSAAFSTVSQSSRTDALLVAVVNLQMIKDIVFLYGFRPSDTKLVKIFGAVVRNSLVSYGLGSLQIGNAVVRTMGDAVSGIPILGSAVSALIDSSIQGLTNGTLTAVIGFQTIRYLNREYRLQDILDGVEVVETEAELEETCSELKDELKRRPARARQGA